MQDVNLIPDSELANSAKSKRNTLIVLVSSVVLGGFLIVLAGLFVVYLMTVKELRDIRVERKPLEDQIGLYAAKEGLVRSIVLKADQVEKIFNNQPPFTAIISRLIELAPTEMTYSEVGLTAPNKVIVTGRAPNTATLEQFLNRLTAKEFGRKTFSEIVLQTLMRNAKGEYEFSLRFTYTGDKQG